MYVVYALEPNLTVGVVGKEQAALRTGAGKDTRLVTTLIIEVKDEVFKDDIWTLLHCPNRRSPLIIPHYNTK